jgi:hypothetical protein
LRRPHFIYLIFSSFLVLLSCSKQENEFKAYLNKIKLPLQHLKIFVLIPSNQCGSCFFYDGSNLSDSVNNSIIVIKAHSKANISNFKHVFIDKEDILNSLSINNNQNRIVVSKNNELFVVSIYDIKRQLDSTYKANHL